MPKPNAMYVSALISSVFVLLIISQVVFFIDLFFRDAGRGGGALPFFSSQF